ncbi:hypothetical protein COCC4DRAFT_140280 [Bipolaris maydis ATCC 48331]|uniref:Uncharacterized protein n=2 Tax=Cochliobolus heterostrophus TaxID=5016 RepID=M2VC06_COCH5|nr:uncharacterized protein COCC4DRAFT_140280 [Bipolaris maydis ATCC 48331]EMD97228.1 hypothetical protein COCHEDRAFT_1025678 [Bipolaris maydis C5]KAJ5029667.1 hypothetical protein J3E73DRAFT_254736 [Bipolaris maydis]ENI04311.1 hypothetical protein COCC4DRAFT_140280 [Bipolaris maydis ATCC 48331]KAJ5061579.1 hypothetical protein J3E74DRAFT_404860 [Bipolaris maydis]KAJ6203189.1 hypothetical protein J3E72DRAFT_369879 [Bipolaris maydis]
MDEASNPKGWTDREILSSLLYLIQKDNITLDWDGGLYAAGRTASGFKQKTNKLIRAFRPEWDAMTSGAPAPQATPKKSPATPRKRKSKVDQEDSEDVPSVKKPRGRPRKKAATPKSEDDEVDLDVKTEPKEETEEQIYDIDADV